MITGAVKNKIDKIWTDIWAGGISNPLPIIEQLTYLMFIRSLDIKEKQNEKYKVLGVDMPLIFPRTESGQSMRWSSFKLLAPKEMYQTVSERVFPAIKNIRAGRLPDIGPDGKIIPAEGTADAGATAFARYMADATFQITTPQLLQKIVTGLDELYDLVRTETERAKNEEHITDADMQGDVYEYMLGKLSSAGQNGQFRTPRHIRRMMVELAAPAPDDLVCDPACGTAGFLVSAAGYIRGNYKMTAEQWRNYRTVTFTGFDKDPTMLRISAMNLMLHGIEAPRIEYKDSVSKENTAAGTSTVVLANPPFKGTVDKEGISDDLKSVTNTAKTELLFVALFLRLLKKGGRCACIVPDGVLFGSSNAHKALRRELVENNKLTAVISMPGGVFKPYAGVSTAVLVFTKTGAGGTDDVWFYDMKSDGYTLDDKRQETGENDIPDILARFKNLPAEKSRARTEQSFTVPKDEIAANGYDLSINKYKKAEYVPVQYEPTGKILAGLKALNEEIAAGLGELEKML